MSDTTTLVSATAIAQSGVAFGTSGAGLVTQFPSVACFEANGGFLLVIYVQGNGQPLKALPTRDAILPAIMLLAAAGDGVISTLVSALPQRYTHSDCI